MSTSTIGLFVRHLALSEEAKRLRDNSDRDLLAAYQSERNEAAFTELMRRYEALVLRTCSRVLGQGPDAEDVFQATFILLARKAGQLGREAVGSLSLGGWLHRVAYRTALNVVTGATRRKAHEQQANIMALRPSPCSDPATLATWNEVQPILDEELDALPEEARRLLIACYLHGKSYTEAAVEFGLPRGSLAWRLQRARELLAARLARRGITVPAVLLAVLLEETAKGAGVPAVLRVHTLWAAMTFNGQAAGVVSVHVASLVKGVLASMAKSSTYVGLLLAGWVGLLGAGLLTCQTLNAWPNKTPESEPPMAVAAERPERESAKQAPSEPKAAPAQEEEKQTPSEPPATPAVEQPAQEGDKQAHIDRYGDPLPTGALARLGTVRLRHKMGGHSLFLTPDGKRLITAGRGEPARLWDAATGRMLRQLGENRRDGLHAAVLSPDGRTLAGRVTDTGDLCLWDTATGTLLHRLKAQRLETGTDAKVPLAFSPDGKTVASMDGQTLRLWEAATGKELWAVDRLQVSCLTYSADGKALIWAGSAGDVHLCDAGTGKELRRWDDGKKRRISVLVCSPDGRLLTTYAPRVIREIRPVGAPPGPPPELVKGSLRLWNLATDREVWQQVDEEGSITDQVGSITAAAFSPDGKVLATGGPYGPIRLWDAATGKLSRRCAGGQKTQCLAFTPDGKALASSGGRGPWPGGFGDQTVHWWDVGSGQEMRRAEGHEDAVCSVAFTPDGKHLIASSWEGSLRVWDTATGAPRRRVLSVADEHFVGGSSASITAAVRADGKTIISAAWERIESKSYVKVRHWDRDSGRELDAWSRELSPLGLGNADRPVEALVISSDGKTVAAPALKLASSPMHLWEAATGKELPGIAGSYLAFSPTAQLVATAPLQLKESGPSFSLWEVTTATELCSVPIEGRVHGLLFSPDGRMVATASRKLTRLGLSQPSTLHLWPLLKDEPQKGGVRLGPARLVPGDVSPRWSGAWAFSPDGRTLALAGEGGTVRLLETATGQERACFAGHDGDVLALSFTPDGRRLASGSRDTTILIWDVTGRLQGGRLQPVADLLRESDLEKLWVDLASDNGERARRAIWTLAAAPSQAMPYLEERLQTAATDAKALSLKVPQLLRDLDDEEFVVRAKAKAELARLGAAAKPALRQALAKSPSLETRRSLEQLLKAPEAMPSGEALRALRAVEVLEHIGTREARQTLKTLTAGAGVGSALIQEVHAALGRLERVDRQ